MYNNPKKKHLSLKNERKTYLRAWLAKSKARGPTAACTVALGNHAMEINKRSLNKKKIGIRLIIRFGEGAKAEIEC